MISVDTNILLYALNEDCDEHRRAASFLDECSERDDVAVCELVLVELYQLLRNPAVVASPCDGEEAATICRAFRENPLWALIESAPVMERVWGVVARPDVPRRWIFDARLAFTLQHHGVDEFATRNVDDFRDLGFARLWDPIE